MAGDVRVLGVGKGAGGENTSVNPDTNTESPSGDTYYKDTGTK